MTTEEKYKIFDAELFPHMGALKTFAYHLTLSETEADDLVQETYLKAHKFIENYELGTNAKAWLFKILKNLYINEYRKKKTSPISVELTQYNQGASLQGTISDIRYELFEQSLGDEVTRAVDALAEEYKTVILLCDIEDFTYEEMAKILDLPIGTVRSRLFRARNLLKDRLKTYAENLGYKDYRGNKNFYKKTSRHNKDTEAKEEE